jgi:hypothetical protein
MIPTERIEPVRKTRIVALAPSEAFDLFTERIETWWPLATHSISGSGDARVRFEGRVGGRVIEITPDGSECSWADVLAWNPPERFVLSWHPSRHPVAATTLEVRFSPEGDDCRIELEHRGWEEYGAEQGLLHRADYEPGWDGVLAHLERAVAPA